jgi:hypothetical protein
MPFDLSQWRKMPLSAALGIGLWVISWTWFLFYIYFITKDTDWIYRLAIAMVLLAVFILRASNWARMIAIMSNVMAILFLAVLAYALSTKNSLHFIIVVGNAIAFIFASYFLFVSDTAAFFASHSPGGREEK